MLRVQTPGDLDLMPPPAFAEWHDEGPSTILAMRVQPWLLESVADDLGITLREATPQLNVRDARIEHLGWALKAEVESKQPARRLYAESLGVALCTQLLRLYGNDISFRSTGAVRKRRLQRAIDYIHEHLDSDLSLISLAAIAGFSASYFRILFKSSTGLAVHQYVLKARVDSAVHLISRGCLSLRDIAVQTGFADQSHMARCVRHVTGKSPRILRANVPP